VTNVKDNKPERRGGRRRGAGRKPNYLKRLGIRSTTAAQLLATVDEEKLVTALLHDKSADVRLRTWITLREQVFGKPRQQIGLAGAMAVASVHQEVSDEDLDAHIKALTEQLGLAPKTLAAVPEGPDSPVYHGQEVVPEPSKPPTPTPVETPPEIVAANFPPAAITHQNHCDKHDSFKAKTMYDVCPVCKSQWQQDSTVDEQRLKGLLPGEPSWSSHRR
jgi:hypothetical protein